MWRVKPTFIEIRKRKTLKYFDDIYAPQLLYQGSGSRQHVGWNTFNTNVDLFAAAIVPEWTGISDPLSDDREL